VSGHRLDFTDRIDLGTNVIVAGRNSSLWTHNRQATKPISVGDFSYLGSEVRLGPGARLGSWSILAMGGVLVKPIEPDRVVVGGVPAKEIRPIDAEDERRLRRKTRDTIPDDAY
jgi:acetyltransferase-like isoleucine patch superfamily enzyme